MSVNLFLYFMCLLVPFSGYSAVVPERPLFTEQPWRGFGDDVELRHHLVNKLDDAFKGHISLRVLCDLIYEYILVGPLLMHIPLSLSKSLKVHDDGSVLIGQTFQLCIDPCGEERERKACEADDKTDNYCRIAGMSSFTYHDTYVIGLDRSREKIFIARKSSHSGRGGKNESDEAVAEELTGARDSQDAVFSVNKGLQYLLLVLNGYGGKTIAMRWQLSPKGVRVAKRLESQRYENVCCYAQGSADVIARTRAAYLQSDRSSFQTCYQLMLHAPGVSHARHIGTFYANAWPEALPNVYFYLSRNGDWFGCITPIEVDGDGRALLALRYCGRNVNEYYRSITYYPGALDVSGFYCPGTYLYSPWKFDPSGARKYVAELLPIPFVHKILYSSLCGIACAVAVNTIALRRKVSLQRLSKIATVGYFSGYILGASDAFYWSNRSRLSGARAFSSFATRFTPQSLL